MKKIFSVLLVLSLFLGSSVAAAEMGKQAIDGSDAVIEPICLDDTALGISIPIQGSGELTAASFSVADAFKQYGRQSNMVSKTFMSGLEAEYILLKINILNTTTQSVDFLDAVEVRAVSADLYEYSGWAFQYNWDRDNGDLSYSANIVLSNDDRFDIKPMYVGHYVIGCKLPNAVVNAETPLRLEFTINGNLIIYNIRK